MDIQSYILSKNYTDQQIEKAEMGDIELDKSLTKAGQAADSKAVGDALKNIKMPEIDTTLTKEGAAADAKAVGEALANINIPEDSGEQIQSDWDQNNPNAVDYIKNKPFGAIPTTIYIDTAMAFHEEWDDDGMSSHLVWENNSFNSFSNAPLGEGHYLLTLDNKSEVVYYNGEGTLKTDFIEVEWSYSRWTNQLNFIVLTSPTYSLNNPAKFVLSAVSIKKLDGSYITQAQSDWNENNQSKSEYIKNRTHHEAVYGEWEKLVDVTGELYYDDMMGEYYYRSFMSADINISIYGEYEYSIVLYDPLVEPSDPDNGVMITAICFSDGMDTNWILEYNGTTYQNYIETITLPYFTSGLAIYRHSILSPMKQLDEKFIPDTIARVADIQGGGGASVQGDWNQNDETAPDYIKNRTHYGTLTRIDYVEEERLSFNFDDMEYRWSMASMPIINKPDYNSSVIVVINGSDYECDVEERWDVKWDPVREDDIDYNYRHIQCGDYEFSENPDENVYMVKYNGEPDWDTYDHYATIEIYTQEGEIKQLDDMYIPDTVARKVDLLELDQSLSVAGYAADARAVGNMFRNNPVVQSDWDQTDNNQMDYIKHKPFGYEADYENQATATLSWTAIDYDMDSTVNWNQQNYIHMYAPDEYLPAGLYQISFYGNSEYVELTNDSFQGGTVKTKSITFEYFDEMGVYINILSNPPSWDTEGDVLTLTPVQLKKIDKDFIDISKSVNADDNRPISSAAVAEALANIGGNPDAPSGGDSAEQVQADWNETDSANPAYIKNKPFGVIQSDPILDFELGWTVQDTEDGMGSERFWNTPTIRNDAIRTPVPAGQYRVSFFNQSTIVELTASSGTIKTDFITLSYYQDRWTNMTIYTITSEPPTWESGSSQLIIAPVEIKKLDSIYVDGSQSDWNETDPGHAGYIQNKPFGKELGEEYANVNLEWYSYEEEMSTYYAWSNSVFNVYRYLAPGTYQLTFDNNSANIIITNSYSGRIETDFITLEYSWDDMDGCAQFRVVSNAPQIWEYNSAKLTLAPITFTTIDLNYLPNGIADWNEADESKASYIRNRTHWDEQTTEWKQVAYKVGQVSYDDMGEAQYTKFTSAEVNVPIKYNSDYRIVITDSKWNAPDGLIMHNGTIVHSYDYGMGDYAIVYNGTTYYDNIDTMTFENGITGIAIYERQIITPMKQLDEKFIPDTIARAVVASDNVLGGVKPATKTDDMTQPVGVDENGRLWTVPSAGGSNEWRLAKQVTLEETVKAITISEDDDGNPLNASEIFYEWYNPSSTESKSQMYVTIYNADGSACTRVTCGEVNQQGSETFTTVRMSRLGNAVYVSSVTSKAAHQMGTCSAVPVAVENDRITKINIATDGRMQMYAGATLKLYARG